MSREERFEKILLSLVEFDEIFYNFARLGGCHFVESIPTACISFGEDGTELAFQWNGDFFDSNSDYFNSFILCHEMLHVILGHGRRGQKLKNPKQANVDMDISINHLLVDQYGFIRSLIDDWEKLCWRDTVFLKPHAACPTFEGYHTSTAERKEGFESLDIHNFISDDEEEGDAEKSHQQTFGYNHEDVNGLIESYKVKSIKKRKFDALVRGLVARSREAGTQSAYHWGSLDRRLSGATDCLPTLRKFDFGRKPRKHKCHFYIDNSGSCCLFGEKFCKVAAGLNADVFDINVFSFDTKVRTVVKTNDEYKISYGGGTDFSCILKHVEETEDPPDIIMVLTDGFAREVSLPAKEKKKWNWFLIPKGTDGPIRNAGRTYKLSQFE